MKINYFQLIFLFQIIIDINSLPPKKDASVRKSKLTLITESKNCDDDVRRLCSHVKKSDDLTLLNCLQDNEKTMNSVSVGCQHFLWSYKRNLTTSTYLEDLMTKKCGPSVNAIKDCNSVEFGHKIPCLIDNKNQITDNVCHKFLNKVGIFVFSDFHLIYKFVDKCNDDISKFKCGRLHAQDQSAEDDDKESQESLMETVTSQANTIDCLVGSITNISRTCQHEILRISELQSDDYHLNRKLYMSCREDRDTLCAKIEAGDGRIYGCLVKHKFDDRMSKPCQDQLTKKQQVESLDAKADYPLYTHCKSDIDKYKCHFRTVDPEEQVLLMSSVLLCLEDAMNRGKKVDPNCKAEVSQRRMELLEDFRVSPELVVSCAGDVKENCDSSDREPGAVLKCLMGLSTPDDEHPKGRLNDQCRIALTHLLRVANPTEDIMLLDPTIRKSCTSTLKNLCNFASNKDQAFQCLIENIASPEMAPECQKDLQHLLFFISNDFRIDSAVERTCHKDAIKLCNGPKTYEETLSRTDSERKLEYHCMYTHYKNDRIKMDILSAQGIPASQFNRSLSVECSAEIFRLIKAQATQFQLDPIVFESCLMDVSKFCQGESNKGLEHECLQKNFDKLQPPCQKAIIDFSQMEDADIRLNRQLTEACMPMTKLFCKDSNPNDFLQCLIMHKRHNDMTQTCQAAIEHVQILSLEEFKIDHRFAAFCEVEIRRYCSDELKGSSKEGGEKIVSKSSIVSCLSKTVVKKLIEGEKHPLSKMCRRQFSFELLQRSDSINLDENLSKDCKADIKKFCKDVPPDQVSTCLRKNQDNLEVSCHKRIFRRERMEALDANFDGRLKKVCSEMINEYCHDVPGTKLFQCLHKRIHEVGFDEGCHKLIILRLERRMHDIRLNPELFADCMDDIKAHCSKNIDPKSKEPVNGIEFEGQIIACLKEKFTNDNQPLKPKCRQRMLKIIVEANANLRLDPILRKKCEKDIHDLCEKEFLNHFDSSVGTVQDCLKVNFVKKKITSKECEQEVSRLLREGKADVHVDGQLFEACEDALMTLCRSEEFGEGRKMSCLLYLASNKKEPTLLNSKCLSMIKQRQEMWSLAAIFEVNSLQDLAIHVNQSSMRTYLFSMIGLMILALILLGICCGRITKRVPVDLKNK